jgi:hypothetical protein
MDNKTQRDQLLTIQDLARFGDELLNDIKKLLFEHHGRPATQWLKSADVKKMLHISDGKLQYLRDRGVIPHTKLGGVTYYNLREIEDLMQSDKRHDR